MILYVDGPDLLDHFTELEDGSVFAQSAPEKSRLNLRRWIARYCEARGCRAVVVFDDCEPGDVRPPTERVGQVKVVNLPYGKDAWMMIAGEANRSALKEHTIVVTSDYRLIRPLERGDVRVLTPQQFVHRVRRCMGREDRDLTEEPDEKFTGLSKEEVNLWMEFFDREQ